MKMQLKLGNLLINIGVKSGLQVQRDSLGWAWKISAARKRTGRMERPSYRPGAKRRIDEQALAGLLHSHPDATLVELQTELKDKANQQSSELSQPCIGALNLPAALVATRFPAIFVSSLLLVLPVDDSVRISRES
jgi:hypothetical protein